MLDGVLRATGEVKHRRTHGIRIDGGGFAPSSPGNPTLRRPTSRCPDQQEAERVRFHRDPDLAPHIRPWQTGKRGPDMRRRAPHLQGDLGQGILAVIGPPGHQHGVSVSTLTEEGTLPARPCSRARYSGFSNRPSACPRER